MKKIFIALLFFIVSGAFAVYFYFPMDFMFGIPEPSPYTVRIGYAHTEKNAILFRTYIEKTFENEEVSVELVTKERSTSTFSVVPHDYQKIKENLDYGQASGEELVGGMMRDEWDGATLGESAFVSAVTRGLPLVAVAALGHEQKNTPSTSVVFRSGLRIASSTDIRGKTIVNYVSGLSGELFLKEFLAKEGLASSDLNIVTAPQDAANVDGMFLPVARLARLSAQAGSSTSNLKVYKKINAWMDPRLSHTLLVFRKDFVDNRPEEVVRIVRAYMRQLQYENNLTKDARHSNPAKGFLHGLQIEMDFKGLDLPYPETPPTVSLELLSKIQGMLLEHKLIDSVVNLNPHIDNRFVNEVHTGPLSLPKNSEY